MEHPSQDMLPVADGDGLTVELVLGDGTTDALLVAPAPIEFRSR